MNAQDTASQLQDLLKAIPRTQTVEYDFIFEFIQEVNKLAKLSTSYDSLISNLSTDTNTENANQLTTAFIEEISLVQGYITKFRAKVSTGVYKSFVNHSKAMAPVYMFIDDDIEDVEKSCQSLEAAIKEHGEAMGQVKAAVSSSGTNNTQPQAAVEQSKPAQQTTTNTPITPQTKSIANVFKALQISNPNQKQKEFLNDIMGGTQ